MPCTSSQQQRQQQVEVEALATRPLLLQLALQ
jgi:hypothetical protein